MIYTSYKKIDEAGRIVVSKEIRKALSMNSNDLLKLDVEGNTLVIKKAEPNCEFCGSEEKLVEYMGKCVCSDCIAVLNEKK